MEQSVLLLAVLRRGLLRLAVGAQVLRREPDVLRDALDGDLELVDVTCRGKDTNGLLDFFD